MHQLLLATEGGTDREVAMKVTIKMQQCEDGQYVAQCTSLPGCTCRAPSRREAKSRITQAIRGYVAAVNNFEPEHLDEEVVEA